MDNKLFQLIGQDMKCFRCRNVHEFAQLSAKYVKVKDNKLQ